MTNKADTVIEEKILYILENFPRVTPSMLQITLGSGLPTAVWHPVLERLIDEGAVFRCQRTSENPAGRFETKTIISSEPITDDDENV